MIDTNVKTRGGIYHVLSQLQLKGIIGQDDLEHLRREYNYGRINGFRQLAEWLRAWGFITNPHNYNQIVAYGHRFGEEEPKENI
jgi:hypothetical protein